MLNQPGVRLLRQAFLLLRSDLRQELRDFELLLTAGFFTVVLLAMFYLSFAALQVKAHLAAIPGLMWLTVAFVGVLTLTRVFDREREADTLRALLAAPVERLAIYLAKAGMTLVVLMVCCAVLVPGLWLMFPAAGEFAAQPGSTALLALLGCTGYVAVGTLFASGLATGAGKNTLLFIILYPLTTPLLMYALVSTRALLDRDPALPDYLAQMAALDLLLLAAAALVFETVLVGSPARRRPAEQVRRDMSRETGR